MSAGDKLTAVMVAFQMTVAVTYFAQGFATKGVFWLACVLSNLAMLKMK